MRRLLRLPVAILAIFYCLGSAYAQTPQIGQNLATLVYLDGRNVVEGATFNLQNDQLLSLEVYDVLPNSTVEFTAQQKGIAILSKSYETNEKGDVKDVLFFPKARATIKCQVKFKTIDGQEKRVVFHLRPV